MDRPLAEPEQDYSHLPLEERKVHSVWKVRLGAYEELNKAFQNSASEDAPCFRPFTSSPDSFKKIVMDSNVAAQEAGLTALCSFLELAGPESLKTRESTVPAICEKGLTSTRAGTKQKSIDALLWYIELDTAEPVIRLMIPSLSAKMPKLVTATVKALNDIYTSFGCKTCSPKPLMDVLPKLFAHADKTVRAETTKLSVTLRSYMGETFDAMIFEKLKPIQQKDLSKEFEKITAAPTPTRKLRSEQSVASTATADEDVSMNDAQAEERPLDPYDLVDEVDVLSKLPSDMSARVASKTWKERVEVLEEAAKEFKSLKIKDDDYHEIMQMMARCLKDANVQVVTIAANIIESLGNGLRSKFNKYVSGLLLPLLERTKEKKASVVEALSAALDVCFKYSSFSEILEPSIQQMAHKTPQVRVESSKYLIRCLKHTSTVPKSAEVTVIMQASTKLLFDSLAPVRDAASEVIGTLMKVVGERQLKQYTENIDNRHMKKIEDFFSNAKVTPKTNTSSSSSATTSSARIPAPTAAASNTTNTRRSIVGSRLGGSLVANGSTSLQKPSEASSRKSVSGSSTTIPSKRGPSSPLKTANSAKMNLTSRSLKPIHSPNLSGPSSIQAPSFTSAEKSELERLRNEKVTWLKEKEALEFNLQEQTYANREHSREIEHLRSLLEEEQNKMPSMSLALQSKETQLQRLRSDLDSYKSQLLSAQQRLQQYQQEQSQSQSQSQSRTGSSPVKLEGETNSTIPQQTLFEDSRSELNRRISGLSISPDKENMFRQSGESSLTSKFSSGLYDADVNDESWKKAAVVTSQLKARIEQMRMKTQQMNQL